MPRTEREPELQAEPPLRLARFGHVALTVRDLERATRFYTELLGLAVSDRLTYPAGGAIAEGVWLRCGSDHHCLALFSTAAVPGAPDPFGLHHLAFEVPEYADLLGAHRRLLALGAWHEARFGGPGWQVRVYLRDPDGNLVELYWDMDRIGWDGRARPYVPIQVIPDLAEFDVAAYLALKASHGHGAAGA